MQLSKVFSSSIDSLNRRIVKVLRFGKSDVQTAIEASPYGFDSCPVKDMIAVYGPTSESGKTVIIGYLNKKQLAEIGESRMYSTDADGLLKFYIHLKNDGTAEVGGNVDNLVRYMPLNQMVTELNAFLNAQLALIASGIATGGGAYAPATASFDISDSKIDELKTL